MIKKNLTYILPVLALSLLVFTNSVLKQDTKKAATLKTSETFSFDNTIDRTGANDFLAKSKENSIRLSKQYQKRLLKSNLTEKLSAVTDDLSAEESFEKADTSEEEPTKEKAKKEETAKKEDEKKKDNEEEKKTVADNKQNSKDNTASARSSKGDSQKSSKQRESESTISSISFSSFTPKEIKKADEEDALEETENTNAGTNTAVNSGASNPKVESLDVFSIAYFHNLLTKEKLQEFEQALKLLLKGDSNPEGVTNAYTAALNFLFTKENEEFTTYDSFIRTQFLRHSTAVSLSATFSNQTMSTEKIEYTAGLLNELVLSWDINQGDSNLFSEVYQLAVLNAINPDIANNEVLLTLQDSIATTSFYISNPGVEVSAN
ncbi:MAG: hypothetical protein ACRBBP_02650 [Bdellovibrionales bacterium]